MSSEEEEEESVDLDSPRPPVMLLQDAYEVSKDFYFFLKQGIKDGGHFEWYEAAAAKAKEMAGKSSVYKPDTSFKIKVGAKLEPEPTGILSAATAKLLDGTYAARDYAFCITQRCSDSCLGAIQAVIATLASLKTKALPESKSSVAKSAVDSVPSSRPAPALSASGDKLAPIIFVTSNNSSKPCPVPVTTTNKPDPPVVMKEVSPKREVKDFLQELPHVKSPDLPASFYNLEETSASSEGGAGEGASAGAQTTIFLQPSRKSKIQHQSDSVEEEEEAPASKSVPERRFETAVQHEEEPTSIVFPAAPQPDQHQTTQISVGSGSGGGGGDNIQRDFSSSNTFAARFGSANMGGNVVKEANSSMFERAVTGGHSEVSAGRDIGPPGPGMSLIDDTIASFDAYYQKIDGKPSFVERNEGGLQINGFGSIPPPFSQSEAEYNPSTVQYSGGSQPLTSNRGYSNPSPQHDPARSAFTPPAVSIPFASPPPDSAPVYIPPEESKFQSRWQPAPALDSHDLHAIKLGFLGDIAKSSVDCHEPRVRQAGKQWPPPSNATWSAVEKDDMFRVKQGGNMDHQQPAADPYDQPAYHKVPDTTLPSSYVADEPAVTQELYHATQPRGRSPPPMAPKHQHPPSYQQHTSRSRAFSPNYYSTPRPFSPTYDAPRPFSPVRNSYEPPSTFDGGFSSGASQSFGQQSSTVKVIRVGGKMEDLDNLKSRTTSLPPPKMGILL